jgi:hypothetical protein
VASFISWLSCLNLWFYCSQNFKLFGFSLSILSVSDEGYSERIWWRLFWAYLMKVILSVSDEGYSERIWWRLFWAYLMKVILIVYDEGYSERIWWRLFWAYLMKVILRVSDEGYSESIWWRLFQKRFVYTTFDITFLLKEKLRANWHKATICSWENPFILKS